MPTTARIAFAGGVSCLAYLVLTVRMSLLEFFPGPGITVDFPKMLGPDWQANTFFLLGWFTVLFGAFLVALAAARDPGRWERRLLAAFPALFAGALVFMYPPQSVDFIHNVADARTLFVFWDNPMVVAPDANKFPIGQSYGGEPAPYGPLWFLLQFPVLIAGDSLQPELHVLKAWTSLFFLATAFVVVRIARRITPGREWVALTLYAWNPFIVMRIAGNGHNDAAMLFFVALALWAYVERDRVVWVLPALAAAVLCKYSAALLVPPVLLALVQTRRDALEAIAIGACGAVVLTVAVFAPLWAGAETFDIVRQQAGKFISSTPHVLLEWLKTHRGMEEEAAKTLAKTVGMVAFAAVAIGVLVAQWRARSSPLAVIASGALVFLAFNLLAVTWFRPWYMLWVLTPLVLVPGRRALFLVLAISMGGMLPDLLEQYRNNIGFFQRHYVWAIAAPVVVAFVPAAVAWVVGAVRGRTPLLLDDAIVSARQQTIQSG